MKRIFITLCSVMLLVIGANAQAPDASKTEKSLIKEEKAKMKEQKKQELENLLKGAGATEDEIKQFKASMESFNERCKAIKSSAGTEEERAEELKVLGDEKNARYKEILGADKYREYNRLKKEAKEKAEATTTPQ